MPRDITVSLSDAEWDLVLTYARESGLEVGEAVHRLTSEGLRGRLAQNTGNSRRSASVLRFHHGKQIGGDE